MVTIAVKITKYDNVNVNVNDKYNTMMKHSLLIADKLFFSQPTGRMESCGDRAFYCASPVVSNNTPHRAKTAKLLIILKQNSRLKTQDYLKCRICIMCECFF